MRWVGHARTKCTLGSRARTAVHGMNVHAATVCDHQPHLNQAIQELGSVLDRWVWVRRELEEADKESVEEGEDLQPCNLRDVVHGFTRVVTHPRVDVCEASARVPSTRM